MVEKRKQPPKGRKTTKKSSGGFLRRVAAFLLTVVFLGFVAIAAWVFFADTGLYSDRTEDWIKSILVAADVQLERDLQVVERDGAERWKVTLTSTEKKDRIVKALKLGIETRGSAFASDEEVKRDGVLYHIIELEKEDGTPLRLILEVRKQRPPKPKPKEAPAVAAPGQQTSPQPATEHRTPGAPYEANEPTEAVVHPDAEPLGTPDRGDNRRLIAVILDDIGNEPVETLQPVLGLKYPITFAVLPYLEHTRTSAYHLHKNHYQIMLHMPMEPENYPAANPGEGAILSNLNDAEIRAALKKALASVPYASGVNNHMGSRITANRTLMRPVLEELRDGNLYFIDSRTQANSIAFRLARDLGLRTSRRDVFLDSEQSYDFAVKQLREARRIADQQGSAIVIGHPYPTSLAALRDQMPKMNAEGYRFVFASDLVYAYNEHL